MKNMNQMTTTLRLLDFMERDDGWGNIEGRKVYQRLLEAVENQPHSLVFRIFLSGVRRTDASFPRESVIELAKYFRGKKGFCLERV